MEVIQNKFLFSLPFLFGTRFTHVLQRGPFDCVIASLAMYLGRTYEDVLVYSPPITGHGLTPDQANEIAMYFGVTLVLSTPGQPWDFSKAILIVPNGIGGLHALYCDGTLVYDPLGPVSTVDSLSKFNGQFYVLNEPHKSFWTEMKDWVFK